MPLHEWLKDDRKPPRFAETPKTAISSEPSPANEWATLELDELVDQLLQEVNGELNTYLYEPDSFTPLAKFTPTRDLSVVADHLGTPAAMYDGEGRKVWENRMDFYGRRLWTDGLAMDMCFRYPGQYEDNETGLSYNRFRYYDAGEGVYISRDPIGLAGGNPTLYGYVGDVNGMTDVLGLSSYDYLFRGERSSMSPDKAFTEGFKPKGTHNDLLLHTTSNTTPGNFVSSSSKFDIAEGFAGKNGYLYEVDTPNGIDVNKALGSKSPFPEQFEHAIRGGVKGSEIKGAHIMKKGN